MSKGVSVEKAEVLNDSVVKLVVKNNGCRQIKLDSTGVVAELMFNGASWSEEKRGIEALVGPSYESPIEVNGIQTKCLLDSGSQVTVIAVSFYQQYLAEFPIQKLDHELVVIGAGVQRVPFLGCITLPVSLPKGIVGTDQLVETVALVGPDTEYSKKVPVIVGTNTFRALARQCAKAVGRHFVRSLPVRCEVAFAYMDVGAGNTHGRLGPVRLCGEGMVIPAGECVPLKGMSRVFVPGTCSAVLVQEPGTSDWPVGVKVVACKVPVEKLSHVKVWVHNVGDTDIWLRKKQVIADVFLIGGEYAIDQVVASLKSNPKRQDVGYAQAHTSQDGSQQGVQDGVLPTFNFGEDAPDEWKASFTRRLQEYQDVFIQHEFDLGKTDATTFDIDLEPGPAIRERPRPLPPRDFEDAKQHIRGLLDAKIIAPSSSSFASPIVLVRKKSGKLRMCVDYRHLNARTRQDSYAVPKIEDLFLTLSGARYFTSLDLSQAYYQVPLAEKAQEFSAFTTPFGLFKWLRMPMGLKNSAPCFQHLMEMVFRDLNLAELIVFLDDILIHGSTLEELGERTVVALGRLRSFGLKLDPEKCIFGVREIKHLGFVLSGEGISPDPDKVEALASWPIPVTVKDIKSFLGFAGFYRRFISGFAVMAKPLSDLTQGYIPRKTQKRSGKKGTLNLTSSIIHLWNSTHQQAFESLVHALTFDTVLGMADKTKLFTLHCDASGTGLGAILYQEQDGRQRVIAYASRGLNKTEMNYPAHKHEFVALKWAMCEKFKDYLLGSGVTVVTDNNPLCYVLKNAKLDATSHRWLASLSIFDFNLKYKKGALHLDADGLSRRPQPLPEEDPEYQQVLEQTAFLREKARQFDAEAEEAVVMDQDVVSALMFTKGGVPGADQPGQLEVLYSAVGQTVVDPSSLDENILDPPEATLHVISQTEWRWLQLADQTLSAVIGCLEDRVALDQCPRLKGMPDSQVFLREQIGLWHEYLCEGDL